MKFLIEKNISEDFMSISKSLSVGLYALAGFTGAVILFSGSIFGKDDSVVHESANQSISTEFKDDTVVHETAYQSIRSEFSETKFDKLEYDEDLDLIVGEAAALVMYFNKAGTHVLIGNVLEVESGRDLSAERRRVLSDKLSMKSRIAGNSAHKDGGLKAAAQVPPAPNGSSRAPAEPRIIDVDLPIENMAVMNEGGKHIVHVVSDYNCGFCRKLHAELPGLGFDIEVREIPTGIFGKQASALKAASVLCSDDKEAAVNDAYSSGRAGKVVTCSEGEEKVAQNTAWARAQGVSGTPAVIMPDGTFIRGANMPKIQAWLEANS